MFKVIYFFDMLHIYQMYCEVFYKMAWQSIISREFFYALMNNTSSFLYSLPGIPRLVWIHLKEGWVSFTWKDILVLQGLVAVVMELYNVLVCVHVCVRKKDSEKESVLQLDSIFLHFMSLNQQGHHVIWPPMFPPVRTWVGAMCYFRGLNLCGFFQSCSWVRTELGTGLEKAVMYAK